MSTLPSEDSLGYQVRMTYRALDRMLGVRLAEAGLKSGYWYYLRALWEQDGLTQKELSEAINVKETTTVTMIAGMEAAKLITRTRDEFDRRKLNVFLTKKGRNLERELTPLATDINTCAGKGIPKRDLDKCLSVLKKMRENVHSQER